MRTPDLGAVHVDLHEAAALIRQDVAAARAEEEAGADTQKDDEVGLQVAAGLEEGEVVGRAAAQWVGEGEGRAVLRVEEDGRLGAFDEGDELLCGLGGGEGALDKSKQRLEGKTHFW